MEDTAAPAPALATAPEAERPVMVFGIDDNEHNFYALQWIIGNFFAGTATGTSSPFKLIIVHAKRTPSSVVGLAGPGGVDVVPYLDSDLKNIAMRVIETAKELCTCNSLSDVVYEVVEGDARNVLCEAVEKHEAHILVLGSHGYGAIKRAVLGSVSDYCAHHVHCTVMIVKKPKWKH